MKTAKELREFQEQQKSANQRARKLLGEIEEAISQNPYLQGYLVETLEKEVGDILTEMGYSMKLVTSYSQEKIINGLYITWNE